MNLRTIDWRGAVVGLRYHAPFARGRRLWLSTNLSRAWSENLKVLTPPLGWGYVVVETRHWDANAFVAIWRGFQLVTSYQTTRQTTGAGARAENRRVQVVAAFAF